VDTILNHPPLPLHLRTTTTRTLAAATDPGAGREQEEGAGPQAPDIVEKPSTETPTGGKLAQPGATRGQEETSPRSHSTAAAGLPSSSSSRTSPGRRSA